MKFVRLLTAGVLTLFASTSMASTVLVPLGDSVDFSYFIPPERLVDPGLFIFDDADTSFTDGLLVPVTGPWETANVAISSNFILGVCDITNCYPETAAFFYDGVAEVQFGEGAVMVSGVAPVPVPAAVWLFGTGLIGLVAVARRRRT